ncbi:MAG: DUF5320 domain-containing protein [Deltaproteobacteria bacterium]|nr:DUF5320 domain-containing protein [Deltaproteobacteria bacterium]
MPGFDRTGPSGAGPMTGGARGFCNPSTRAYAGTGYGYGLGRGFRGGFGRGFRGFRGYWRGYGQEAYPYPAGRYVPDYGFPYGRQYGMKPEDEARMLRNDLDAIKKRLEDLESSSVES